MKKHSLLFGFLFLTLVLSFIPFVPPNPFVKADSGSWYGNDSYDDTYEYDGSYYPTLGVVRAKSDTSAPYTIYDAGWHFDTVTVPQGSTILSANLTLLTTNLSYDDYDFTVYGHDVDDSGDFNSDPEVNGRSRTTANHVYTANGVGIGWKTYNVTDIAIEVLGREGWQSGNGLTFMFISGTGTNDRCDWDCYDTNPSYRGELHITYTPPPDPPTYDSLDAEKSHVFYDEYVFLNSTISIPDGHVTDLVNCTIGLNDGIILKYDNATDTFSEYADPSSYVVLNATACERSSLNSTQVELSFNVKFVSPCPPEIKDASASTSKVFASDDQYASRSYVDWFYLWQTGNVLGVEDTPFAWGWENASSTESILNQTSETSTNLIAKYDNATLTTRGTDYGSTVTNYATLYVIDHGFVWGWSSTIYDVYRNQSYECIGEAGYQDWLYTGLFAPPTFAASFVESSDLPWYVPIIGYLAAVLLPFMIIAYYWNKARDWKTGLMVLFVCIMCYILFLTLWNLSDALMYWVYR